MKKELNILLSRPSSYYKNSIIKNSPKFNFNKPVVLFGAAKMGLIYIELCKKNKIKLIAFCDNDNRKNNTYLNNVLIVNPLTLRKYFNKDIQIINTSLYDEEIRKPLIKQGWKPEIIEKALVEVEKERLRKEYRNKNRVTVYLDSEVIEILEKRAKKKLMKLPEMVEDILRRSCTNIINKPKPREQKIDDLLVTMFSKAPQGRKKKSS